MFVQDAAGNCSIALSVTTIGTTYYILALARKKTKNARRVLNKEDRDKKRRQRAIERIRIACQEYEAEINKAEKAKGYIPDLDDLEKLVKCFENLTKCIRGLNRKADRARKDFYNEGKESYRDE